MITLDGSEGHGGGSVLRIASGLSVLTKTPIKISNIRINRPNPGLRAQHLTGLQSLSDLCGGKLLGDELGSTEIEFYPGNEIKDSVAMSIETAGSVALAIQPIMIASALSNKRIYISINGGGTAVKWAPPVDFLENVTFRLLGRMGLKTRAVISRPGYYPEGGARAEIELSCPPQLMPICMPERGKFFFCKGIARAVYGMDYQDVSEALSSGCSSELEKYFSRSRIGLKPEIINTYDNAESQGFSLTSWVETENCIIGASESGDRKTSPDIIANDVSSRLIAELNSGSTIDVNAADQIIPFLALTRGSEIKIKEMTGHIQTSIELAETFLKMKFSVRDEGNGLRITC